jgi:alginate O-acetyltransferase complex protein AlgI
MTSFTGLAFLLLFLPCLLIFYYVPIKNIKYKNVILILFSLAFYILDEPLNIFFIACFNISKLCICIFILFI